MAERDDQDRVDPRAREDDAAESGRVPEDAAREGSNPDQRAGLQRRQAEQNHSENDRYDPSVGAKHDQKRRNDKQGQMGG